LFRSYDASIRGLQQQDGSPYTKDQWAGDQLLPVLRDLVEVGDPLKLRVLDIRRVSRICASRWTKAFDFHSIQKFALMDTRINTLLDAGELWISLKDMGVSFNQLITDVQSPELLDFIGSFKGLEMFLPCRSTTPFFMGVVEWLPAISEHFRTLKHLLIPRTEGLDGFCNPECMQTIVDGCPNLEEFGFAMREQYFVSF
jgi:hypothetical protein